MKRFFQAAFSLSLAASASTLLSGCGFLTAPEPAPLPEPVPTPKPGVFVPTDFNISGIELNKAGDPALPEYFDAVRVDSGELLWVRSAEVRQVGNPPKNQISYGAPDVVHLAGISVPEPGKPGAQDSISTLRRWTTGRELTIEQDKKYPVDLQNRRRVQIFFLGGKNGTQKLNLNRMMVRSGFAVVNVFEPTIFDVKGWLNDEEYARTNRLGLWKLGILLNERQAPPLKKTTKTKITTTTSTPGMPGSAMPGAAMPGSAMPGAAMPGSPAPAAP